MQESGIFKQASFYRSMTLMNVRHVTEEMADQLPEGFNNTIRWNMGHILYVQDALLTSALGRESYLPESYAKLFAPGTKPSQWNNEEVPDLKTLYRALKSQEETLKDALAGRLSEEAVQPFCIGEWIEMPTIGEIYNFSLFHEGMHVSTIKHLVQACR